MNISKLGIISGLIVAPCALYFAACESQFTPNTTMRQLPLDVFELDGNPINDNPGPEPGEDWDSVLTNGGLSVAHTDPEGNGVLEDPAPETIFVGGGSKDNKDITEWKHKNGSVPDKDDITNAYAAVFDTPAGVTIVFGADRFDAAGDAQMGFWFNQATVEPQPNGSFSGAHIVGDLLVLANFEGGDPAADIQVLEWVGSGGNAGNGALQLLLDADAALCTNPAGDACAITNTDTVASPWEYIPKGATVDSDFTAGTFFEGAVNLSALFEAQDSSVPCFATFLAETRSSTSDTAQLKDFATGRLQVCNPGIEVTTACTLRLVPEDGALVLVADYAGKVCNNNGGGVGVDLSQVELLVDDNADTPDDTSDDTVVVDFDDPNFNGILPGGMCMSYSGSYRPTSIDPMTPEDVQFDHTVTASGLAPFDFGVLMDTASASCPLCPACVP